MATFVLIHGGWEAGWVWKTVEQHDVDVVIERCAADAPFGVHERFRWQRRQRRLVELLKSLAATPAPSRASAGH